MKIRKNVNFTDLENHGLGLPRLKALSEKINRMEKLQERQISDCYRMGYTLRDIAEAVDMSHTKIAQIVNG